MLAISYNICPPDWQNNLSTSEQNLIFLGAVAMEDSIRIDAPQAIEKCQQACVTPIMITGDHLQTATVIAKN